MNVKIRQKEGITLIALVITIIVLLILAGVTIATLTGDNGILSKATEAKEETEKARVVEEAKTDILGKQAENEGSEISESDLKEVLGKYFTDVPEELPEGEALGEYELTAKEEYGGYKIKVGEIWRGELEKEKEYVEVSEDYKGYYADIDGNGGVDGIIYADLAKGGSGQWTDSDGTYEIPKVESGLKNYYVSQEGYEGPFGTMDVLTGEGSGAERFYVMALEDVNPGTRYCWYDAASGQMSDYASTTSQDFGTGRKNTETMIAKWNSKGYGEQDDNGTYKDMWGVIQSEVGNINDPTWFVPSRAEWSAFGDYLTKNLGLTTSNYNSKFGLNSWYWSSSQYDASGAYYADFYSGYTGSYNADNDGYVRLSATF